jgi:acyl dehydratase
MTVPSVSTVGARLPEARKKVTQEVIDRYAEASGDFNPIHVDQAYAAKTPLGGTIAHGMLVMAYASEMMAETFGQDWLTGGRLEARFRAPARPGDVLTVGGKVSAVEPREGHRVVRCDVIVHNQRGETVMAGEAQVKVRADENSS